MEGNIEMTERRFEYDFSKVPEIVFLEDVSAFGPVSEAQEFRAGYHNTFDRRFAKVVDGYQYAPQRRFAFGN